MDFLPSFLAVEATRAPLYIIWLVAIVVALVRWQQHPRVSLVACLSIMGLWAVSAASIALNLWLPWNLRAKGMSIMEITRVTTVVSLVSSLFHAGCWVGVVIAIFGWRNSSRGTMSG